MTIVIVRCCRRTTILFLTRILRILGVSETRFGRKVARLDLPGQRLNLVGEGENVRTAFQFELMLGR